MSGSFPATPELQDIQISSTHPTFISTAHSGKRQARSRAAQMWSISGSYAALSREVFAPLFAFMLKQKGQYESFTYIPPVYGDARGDVSSCTASAASAGDTEVTVTMTGTLKEGDYVKFASHDKVYMVIDDLTGNGDLSIFPDLIADVAGSTAVLYDDVTFTMRMVRDDQSFTRGAADLHTTSIEMVEVI